MTPRKGPRFGNLLTAADVASELGVSRQWVNTLVRQGKLQPENASIDGERQSTYVFHQSEVERYLNKTLNVQVDWSNIRGALVAWQAAKERHDTEVAHKAHVEASAHMAKGNLIRLMTREELVRLSELLQADDPQGILALIDDVESRAQSRPSTPRRYYGGPLRTSWSIMLREMYLRFAENLPPLSLSELEALATEGPLMQALAQLEQRDLITWGPDTNVPPQITDVGCERAEHMHYHIIRRYESPGRTMEWYDDAATLSEARAVLDQHARQYPDAEHEIEIWESS